MVPTIGYMSLWLGGDIERSSYEQNTKAVSAPQLRRGRWSSASRVRASNRHAWEIVITYWGFQVLQP